MRRVQGLGLVQDEKANVFLGAAFLGTMFFGKVCFGV
jgi:hypothetical protein